MPAVMAGYGYLQQKQWFMYEKRRPLGGVPAFPGNQIT
jgi:hypothetical protein